jgi:hypothetical protein
VYRRRVGGAGANETEARARAVNATAWEPPPGMVKVICRQCGYRFSAPGPDTLFCADCAAPRRKVGNGDASSELSA